MAHQHGDVAHRKDQRQRHRAPQLEADPEVPALCAPHQFVQYGHDREEDRPVDRQQAPATLAQPRIGAFKQHLEQRLSGDQAISEHDREHRVDDRRLHLDEGVVVEPQRQTAEHEHEHARNP